jgi:hypothetical protein
MHPGVDEKRRPEKYDFSDTASGHGQLRNGGANWEDMPTSTQHLIQTSNPSSSQRMGSDDGALIQSISRTIMAQARTHASESASSASLYQSLSLINCPLVAHRNDESALPVAGIQTDDQDTELAGAIANLIRTARPGGEESSGTGTAPPAYREDPL